MTSRVASRLNRDIRFGQEKLIAWNTTGHSKAPQKVESKGKAFCPQGIVSPWMLVRTVTTLATSDLALQPLQSFAQCYDQACLKFRKNFRQALVDFVFPRKKQIPIPKAVEPSCGHVREQ